MPQYQRQAATSIGKTGTSACRSRRAGRTARGHRDERHQRRVLEHRDRLVAGRRHDHPHRLRQHDPAQHLRAAHAERLRRPRPGRGRPTGCRRARSRPCSRLGQRQRRAGGHERGQEVVGVDPEEPPVEVVDAEQVAELAVERQAELEPAVEDPEVAEQDQQHQPGNGPEEPGVDPRDAGAGRVRRQPHDRQHDARAPHRTPSPAPSAAIVPARPSDDRRAEHVVDHERPAEGLVGEQHVREHGGQHRITATATQRPGWRTGTALMAPAGPVGGPVSCGVHDAVTG